MQVNHDWVREDIIPVGNDYYLSEIWMTDIPFLVQNLNDDDIYRNMVKIPKPFTDKDGEWFVDFCRQRKKMFGKTMEWGIRNGQGDLIGGIGLHRLGIETPHRDMIGYWLSKAYWNQKIMSRTVQAFSQFVFERDPLIRLEANVYTHNLASCRILEKAGFLKEGIMKKYFFKDGLYIDSYLYALVKE